MHDPRAGAGGAPRADPPHWGHSLAVDGWGKVLAENADAVAALKVRVDTASLQPLRQQMPVLQHNRFQTSLTAPSDKLSSNQE